MKIALSFVSILYALVSVPSSQAAKKPGCIDLQSFCSYEDVQNYLAYLKQNYPENFELEEVGQTWHGYKLTLAKIRHTRYNEWNRRKGDKNATANKTNSKQSRDYWYPDYGYVPVMGIWVDSMIHAREWIALAVSLYLLEQLVEKSEKNQDMLEYFDWYIMPIVNPEGYEYSRNTDRMWRKNVSPDPSYCDCKYCGVDLNRNFDIGFSNGVDDPCAEVFHGPWAESEPEVQAVAEKLRRLSNELIMYVALHSAGFKFYIPWAHTPERCWDYYELAEMTGTMSDAIYSLYGRGFTTENFGESPQGPAGGGADDYAKSLDIKYSFTIELPSPQNPSAPSVFHVNAKEDLEMAAKEQFAGFRAATERLTGIYVYKTITPVSGSTRSMRKISAQIIYLIIFSMYAVQTLTYTI